MLGEHICLILRSKYAKKYTPHSREKNDFAADSDWYSLFTECS